MADDVLTRAFQAHQDGDIAAAVAGYKDVLSRELNNVIAMSLLNLIALQATYTRYSKRASLGQLNKQGFLPGTVFDVGAQVGTPELFETFPDAHHVMFEPVVECEPALKRLCQNLKSAEYRIAAVAERSGFVNLGVSADRRYSGIVSGSRDASQELREIPAVSLNELCAQRTYQRPYLVKIDVDGAEIDVLKGASALTFQDTVFVIEATINDGTPRFPKILEFFKPYDFVLHDIIDPLFRPSDGALWQVDVVMVHANSKYRQNKTFA